MPEKVLVTGASGFIASHTILNLLKAGYAVRGTLRNLERGKALRSILVRHEPRASDIEFVQADLLDPQSWQAAMPGCHKVLHLASPVPTVQPGQADEVVQPAMTGTRYVLEAAAAAGIKRIVVTSSVAAVFDNQRTLSRTYTAADWKDENDPANNPYSLSKVTAEKTAWRLATALGLELTTINPGLVLGPALEPDYGASLEALRKLLNGDVPFLPRLGYEIVDVRDVATLHRLALENSSAAGQRLLCGAGFRWFREIAATLQDDLGDSWRIPSREMPDWVTRLGAIVVPELKSFLSDLSVVRKLDCSPARSLGWSPRPPETAILDGARSLIAFGALKT